MAHVKILRQQPNLFQKWWNNQVHTWRNNRYIPGTFIHRIRYWPLDLIIGIPLAWLAINIFALLAFMFGGGVGWQNPDNFQRVLYAPLYWIEEG